MVDDGLVYLRGLSRMLESAGHEVFAFAEPQHAQMRLPRLRPYAVPVDMEMPGMSGLELIEVAKSIPALAAIPYLVITGHADVETARAAAQHDLAGFTVKAGARATVLAKLQAVLLPVAPELSP